MRGRRASTQVVSSLLLEAFKESLPAFGEEVDEVGGVRNGPPPSQQDFWSGGGQAHSRSAREPKLLLLISVTRLHGFLEVVIGKALCLLKEWE